MTIRTVSVTQLRSHEQLKLECAPDITILSGPNGSGKTSILEAISLCSIGKTFVPVQDAALIREGATSCSARVEAMGDLDVPYRVNVEVQEGVRKKISNTLASNVSVKDLIGELPVVALSPDHKAITFGGPADRRAFIDAVMAQCSKRYTALLFEHRKLLKHRNALLCDVVKRQGEEFELWTQKFIDVSAEIIQRRAEFIAELGPIVQEEYSIITNEAESIELKYVPDGVAEIDASASVQNITDQLMQQWKSVAHREFARETTSFGPQKDDVELLINNRPVRTTASQGQHKSLLIALKLAECRILQQKKHERPVVLLDDVFSELDEYRSAGVLQRILHLEMQCFISTTNGADLLRHLPDDTTLNVSTIEFDLQRNAA